MTVIERTIQCTTCRGSGEMESDDSTDDRIYKCWACDGTGKIADRRRPDPQLARAVGDLQRIAVACDNGSDAASKAEFIRRVAAPYRHHAGGQ